MAVAAAAPGWFADAACVTVPPGAVCEDCTVRWDCLMFAFETRPRSGIYGGMDGTERVELLARAGGDAREALVLAYSANQETDARSRYLASVGHPATAQLRLF